MVEAPFSIDYSRKPSTDLCHFWCRAPIQKQQFLQYRPVGGSLVLLLLLLLLLLRRSCVSRQLPAARRGQAACLVTDIKKPQKVISCQDWPRLIIWSKKEKECEQASKQLCPNQWAKVQSVLGAWGECVRQRRGCKANRWEEVCSFFWKEHRYKHKRGAAKQIDDNKFYIFGLFSLAYKKTNVKRERTVQTRMNILLSVCEHLSRVILYINQSFRLQSVST